MTDNLERRLTEHNKGKTRFTRGHMPWKLVYYEEVLDYSEGRKREKYLKSASGRQFIRNWLEKSGHVPFADETLGSPPA